MSLTRKIAHNLLYQFIGKGASSLLGLIALAFLTRYLGREGFGEYTTVLTFLQIVGILIDFGLTLVTIQMISENMRFAHIAELRGTPQQAGGAPDKSEAAAELRGNLAISTSESNNSPTATPYFSARDGSTFGGKRGVEGVTQNKILSNIFAMRLISAFLCFGLASIIALFMPYSAAIKIGIAISSAAFFFNTISQVPIGVFQKEIRTEFMMLAEILNRTVFLGLVSTFVFLNLTLNWFFVANSISMTIYFFILYLFSRKFSKISFAFNWKIWKEILWRSYPLTITIILNLVYLRADTFLLSLIRTQEEVGLYGAPYKIIDAITAFIFVFVGMVLGVLSESWAMKDAERFRRVTQRTLDALMSIAFPLALGGIFLAKPIMIFVAGREFEASAPIFRLLLIALWWIFFGTLFTHVVIAIKKQHRIVWGFAVDAILSLMGYLIFIPKYSYWGAAGVTIFSEMFIAVWAYVLISKITGYKISLKIPLKSFVAAVAMIGFLVIFPFDILLVQLIAGALFYTLIFYLLGGFNKQMIKEIISLNKA